MYCTKYPDKVSVDVIRIGDCKLEEQRHARLGICRISHHSLAIHIQCVAQYLVCGVLLSVY